MKTKIRNNKRGVSPLIAAVLLMVLTVVVGALIMNWVNRYVKEQVGGAEERTAGEIACGQDVSFKLLTIEGDTKFCLTEDNPATGGADGDIIFTVDNGQNKKLEGFRVRLIDDDGDVFDVDGVSDSKYEVEKASAKKIDMTDMVNATNITSVRIIPFVLTSDVKDPVLCSDNYLDVQRWDACS